MNGQLIDNHQPTGSNWGSIVLEMFECRTQEIPSVSDQTSAVSILAKLEDQMESFEREHRSTVAELAQNYIFAQETSVEEFLRSHRILPQLLMAALPYLRQQFGSIVFSLRAVSDDYGWQTMFVDALWPGQAADALAAIDRFEDEWWIANSSAATGSLNFTYRLV
ncbi:MAG: hypothetical protein HIU91_04315 [Acidobacteria bacterium]|nr:hypothetical protein [Acidobacteriota bacterium]